MAIDCDGNGTTSRYVTVLPNEKRIIYRKKKVETVDVSKFCPFGGVEAFKSNQRSVKADSDYDISDAVRDVVEFLLSSVEAENDLLTENENFNDMVPFFQANVDLSKRAIVLERLRRVRFNKLTASATERNVIGPSLDSVLPTSSSNTCSLSGKRVESVRSFVTGIKRPVSSETPKLKKLKSSGQFPQFCSGDMVDLEPGEVPGLNYIPMKPAAKVLPVYCVVYPCPPDLLNVPFNLFNYVNLYESSEESDENAELLSVPASFSLDACQPSKTITELFQRAKEKAASGTTILDAESDARKMNKKEKRRLGRLYRVKFTNDIAMLRHHANRWIRGGRLSTTGKFIEADDDDDNDERFVVGPGSSDCVEEADKAADDVKARIAVREDNNLNENLEIFEKLCQESPPVSIPPKKKIDIHVIYEDTHRYDEYNKYWNELHGYSAPRDDVGQAWQRKWYQYYNYAVSFIDIPEDYMDDANDNNNTTLNDKMELYYQQWRWKQVQQFNGNSDITHKRKNDHHSKVWSDGVSFAGEPILYEANLEQPQ